MMNLAVGLSGSAKRYPGKEAVVIGALRMTYAHLEAKAKETAAK